MAYGGGEGDRDMNIGYVWQLSGIPEIWTWCVFGWSSSVCGGRRDALIAILDKYPDLDCVAFRRPPESKSVASYPTDPGAPLTWQQAQARFDAGLEVETLRNERHPDWGWLMLGEIPTSVYDRPANRVTWHYRVPAAVTDTTVELDEIKTALSTARDIVRGIEHRVFVLQGKVADRDKTVAKIKGML
jgi:hypothetical protein